MSPGRVGDPLSYGQQRMWLLDQLAAADGAVNLVMAVRLRGVLTLPALAQAFADVVARHEVLRSVVELRDGQLVQVPGARRVPVALVDYSGFAPARAEELAAGLREDETRTPFDLERGPLMRVTIARLTPAEHVVAVALHHSVTDGWSMGLLAGEVSAVYRTLRAGRPGGRRGVPPIQYREFARWQRAQDYDAHPGLAALVERLDGLADPRLPLDRPGRADRRHGAAIETMSLPPRLSTKLAELRRREGGSLFMLVLAGLMTVIHRLGGQRDVAVGTLAAGRARPELESLIGYFGNVLVVRAEVGGELPFREVWRRVREGCLAAYEHQDVPYEKVLERLRLDRDPEARASWATPLVRVLCVMQQPSPTLDLPGLAAQALHIPHGVAQFDLTVELREQPTGLRLAMQYDTDVFEPESVRLLGRYLRAVLEGAAADPDRPCGLLPLSSAVPGVMDGEPGRGLDETLPGAFGRVAAARPDAVAVVHNGRAASYRCLDTRSNQVAHALRGLGVRSGDAVGVCLDRSVEAVIALLGVVKAGAAWLPLDPGYPAERLSFMLADSGARCVITTRALRERLGPALADAVEVLDVAAVGGQPARPVGLRVSPAGAAYLMYTSGTTGRPKGVLGTHRGALNRFHWMWQAHPFQDGERTCQRAPLSFGDSVWEVFGPLLRGVPAEVIDTALVRDPRALVAHLAGTGVSRIVLVPSVLRLLLDSVPELGAALPALRLWVSSGERLPAELAARFAEAVPGALLLNLYGSTEVAADATGGPVDVAARPVTIGRAIAGVTAVVTDASGSPLPWLVAGELRVGGPVLALGYHGRPGETAARFVPDPAGGGARVFRTGDLARVRADGELDYLGRLDDQVQIRGIRVEPGEVEEALLRHPAVDRAAVTAWQDRAGSHALAGYVVLRAPVEPERLRDFLRGFLPSHLVPSALVEVPSLPLTPSGKVDRARLPRPPSLRRRGPGTVSEPPAQPPRTDAERVVAEVFAELLPVPWTSVHDSFFALGGHSIVAAVAVHRLRERRGVSIGLRELFEAPTIAELAALVSAARPPEGDGAAVELVARPAEAGEPFPLTDVQQAYYVGREASLELGNVATHAYFEVDVEGGPEGGLDVARFEDAVRRTIDRHPALRTVVGGDGLQRVLPSVPPYVVRAGGDPDATRAQMSHQILPADTWPLFDLRVTMPSAGSARIHVSIDALIADAYSVQLLMAEIARRYREPSLGLEPLELTFRDCVLAEVAARATPAYERALDYWRQRLDELPPGPELPLAAAPGSVDTPRFRRWSGVLPSPAWQRFTDRATEAGVTPAVALLAVFTELVTAWSRRPHYTLTLTLFNRPTGHPQASEVVGDFTSLTLLEVDHRAPGTFLARARALQRRMWADLDNRLVSGVTVLREWARRQGRAPGLMAPVVFTSNLGLPAPAGEALGRRGFAVTQTPQLYLDHQVGETADGLELNWDAIPELFPPGLLDDMYSTYTGLLRRLVDAPWDEPVAVELPPRQERERAAANATAAPGSAARLHELTAHAAALHAPAPAVICGDVVLSHGEVAARSAAVALRLRRAGVRRGELVGVAMHRGWEQVVAVLGVSAADAAYVPLDPELPAERLALLATQTGLRFVLTQPWLHGRLPGLHTVEQLVVDVADGVDGMDGVGGAVSSAAAADGRGQHDGGPADLAYVIFTSGSTGTPKGVMIDHRGAVNTVLDINRRYGIGPGDRVLALSSLSFDLSVWDVYGALAAGATVVIPRHEHRRDPRYLVELAGREGVTVWNSVPALLCLAVEIAESHALRGLADLRIVMLSGDWIPVDLPGRVRVLAPGAGVHSLGGATEGSIWSVCHPVGDREPGWPSIPYGRPLTNQTMHVLDARLRPRPEWVAGDLYIGGDGVALGYWGDPERTAASFLTHPRTGERLYRTGDVARYRPGAVLEFLGREDDQVKISGYRAELGEVEAALARVPGVAACAVAAVGPPRGDKRLAAYYVPEAGAALEPAALRAALGRTLPAYLVPGTFTAIEALPLTSNGKIDRAALVARASAAPWPAPHGTWASHAPSGALWDAQVPGGGSPATAGLEAELARLWAAVLGVPAVGRDDNFFELGGTSLVAVRLLARLEAELGTRIPLVRLFESPTVAQLAAVVARGAPASAPAPPQLMADPAGRHEPFPLTDIQQAYWMGRHAGLQLGGVATHSYVELDVDDLDLDRLQRALNRLIDRHDALRTVVLPDGRQRVLPGLPRYAIARTDLRGAEPTIADRFLSSTRERLSHQVRDPGEWPLFEIAAAELDGGRTRLYLSLDLLIADGRSFRILQHELLVLYQDEQAELPPVGCTFRDYVLTVERLRATREYTVARDYWRRRLDELPPAPGLPMQRGLAELDRPRFERLEGRVDAAGWETLCKAAAGRNLTPSGLLCAAFAEVLAMWSQSARFIVTLTTFGRQALHPDVDAVVGDFTSTTLLAVDASGPTFAARAGRLQEQIFLDLEHRRFGGVEVARLLRADPRRRVDAVAPVVFTSMLVPEYDPGYDSAAAPAPSWRSTAVYSVSQTPQVLLDHQVYEHDGTLIYTWDHVAEAFPPGLIEAMFDAYRRLLRSLHTNGDYWEVPPAWTR